MGTQRRFSRSKLVGLIGGLLLVGSTVAYQNCGPTGGGGALQLGSASPLITSSINVSQTTILPNTSFSASINVTDALSPTVNCQWMLTNSTNAVVGNYASAVTNGLCRYGAVSPAALGNYTLSVVASDTQNNTSSQSVVLTVSNTAPSATPTPGACYASGYNCYGYSGSTPPSTVSSCSNCCNGYRYTISTVGYNTNLYLYYCN